MAEAKKTSPVFWFAFVGICAALYLFTSGGEEPVVKRTKRPVTSSSKDKLDEYTAEDRKAKFAAWTEAPKDVFKPLVIRHNGTTAAISSNGLPLVLTGGEPNWAFTGVVDIDGVQNALVENSASGDGSFIKGGETWKSSRVLTVTRDSVVLQGSDGVSRTIRLGQFGVSGEMSDNDNSPVKPPLSGEIGGMSVLPSSGGIPGGEGGSVVIGN